MSLPESTLSDDLITDDPALREANRTHRGAVLKARGLRFSFDLSAEERREMLRLHSLIWQAGRIISRDQFRIDPFDEGLCFGRGVWESTKTVRGVPWLLPSHVERLLNTAALLGLSVYPAQIPTTGVIQRFVRSLTSKEVVLRVNVSAECNEKVSGSNYKKQKRR